jgi:Trk K+ transport system NAD-binding subunit
MKPAQSGPGSRWRPLLWRGLALAMPFVAGFIGLSLGVEVSQRDLVGIGVAERAYYVLGLFVLGGLDIGTPVGGPAAGRALLWMAYFLAPLITASALLEAAMRLIAPLAFRMRPFSDHVVVAGAGRLAMVYVRKLRERDPERTVLVVERDPAQPRTGQLRDLYRAVIVGGDITSDDTLHGLRVNRAHRVLLLTGDDFANLDAAAKMLGRAPRLAGRIVAHVSDLRFMRETAGSSVAQGCEIFNGHEFAATNLVSERLLTHFRSTPHRDLVVLAGFGRFGQTVLQQLQRLAAGSFDHVVIIDQHATRNARWFDTEPGFDPSIQRTVIEGDLQDPEVWGRVAEIVERVGRPDPVIIVGSGDDGMNLHVGLSARKRHPGAYVVVRSFEASPFASEIASEAELQAFDLAGLIEDGMPDGWF